MLEETPAKELFAQISYIYHSLEEKACKEDEMLKLFLHLDDGSKIEVIQYGPLADDTLYFYGMNSDMVLTMITLYHSRCHVTFVPTKKTKNNDLKAQFGFNVK